MCAAEEGWCPQALARAVRSRSLTEEKFLLAPRSPPKSSGTLSQLWERAAALVHTRRKWLLPSDRANYFKLRGRVVN